MIQTFLKLNPILKIHICPNIKKINLYINSIEKKLPITYSKNNIIIITRHIIHKRQ